MDAGTRLNGRYRLDRHLARGGMSDIWVAEDERLQRSVAVKAVGASDPELTARLQREARLLAQLDHPGIVRLLDAGAVGDCPFLVMELVSGPPLHERLARTGPLPPDEAAAIGATLAAGLAQAHERGIVHRDLKPSNVLLEPDGRARLADFGIARTDDATALTQAGLAVGTVAYVSPEQLRGTDVGPPSDVYSLGLVLLEALTGERPFAGPDHEVAHERLERQPSIPADVPTPLAELLADMTRLEPDARPSAADVSTRLAQLAPAPPVEEIVDPTTESEIIPLPVGRRVRRRVWIAAAAAVIAIVAITAAALPGGGSTPEPVTQQEPTTTVAPSITTPVSPSSVPVESTVTAPPSTAPPIPESVTEGQDSGGQVEVDAPVVDDAPIVGGGPEPEPQDPPTTETTVAPATAGSSST